MPAPASADLPPPSVRTNLIIVGAGTTAVSYGLALGASYLWTEDQLRGAKSLRIPFAGPWLSLSKTGCPTADPGCSKVPLVIGAVLQVFDGVAQLGGLGLIGEGLFLKTSSARARQRAALAATRPSVHAIPFGFERGAGFGVVGTF